MRILAEYLIREFLRYFGLLLGIFTFIYLLIDFLDHIDNFLNYKSTFMEVLWYYIYKTPFILIQMSSISVLLTVIIVLSQMNRSNEITALKAGGVSVFRLSLPLILMALVVSLANFALAEGVVPYANSRVAALWAYEMHHEENKPRVKAHMRFKSWYKADKAIYNVRRFHGATGIIEGVSLYFLDDSFHLTRRVDAKKGVFRNGQWTFMDGTDKTIGPKGQFKTTKFKEKQILLQAKPEDFQYVEKTVDQMSLAELDVFIAKLRREGYDTTYYQIDRQVKFSLPFVCTVLTLLAIPLTLRQNPESGMARAVAIGVGVAFAYLAFFAVSRSLGHSETLPVFLAAWLPSIVFSLSGAYLLVTLRQ